MKVFVTGATGFVGHYILAALRQSGHFIIALTRPGSEPKLSFLEGIRIAHGNAEDVEQLKEGMKGADAVIHLVGIIRENASAGVTFEKLHYEATRNMVTAAKLCGIGRFIHMSANGAAQNGVSDYQTTKWRAEQVVRESGLDWTIFRPSVIFGDSDGKMEFTSELARIIRVAPVTPVFGDGKYMLDPVSVLDVASCFVKSLAEPGAVGRVFHLGGGRPMAFSQIIQTIGKALGKPRTPTVRLPFAIIKPMAAALGRFGFFPVTVDQLEMLKRGNTCPELEFTETFNISPIQFTYQNLQYLKK